MERVRYFGKMEVDIKANGHKIFHKATENLYTIKISIIKGVLWEIADMDRENLLVLT